MTKRTQALIAAASSVALFGGALTLISPARAEFDWKAFGQAAARELQEYGDREIERNSRQTFCTTNYIGNTAYTNCY